MLVPEQQPMTIYGDSHFYSRLGVARLKETLFIILRHLDTHFSMSARYPAIS